MNLDRSSESIPWPHRFGDSENGATGEEDDFTSFLDLDNDFSNLEGLQHGPSGLDTPMGRLGFGQYNMSMHDGLDIDLATGNNMQIMDAMMSQTSAPDNQLPSNTFQTQEYMQMMDRRQYQIPLTPVSADISGTKYASATFQNNQQLYGTASFTPLVSPAQTPLDTGLRMPEYPASNEYFSPLNSPAINAQRVQGSRTQFMSPVESINETPKRSDAAVKRGRHKETTSVKTSARTVRQPPAMKPRSRRRPPSVTTVPPELINAMQPGTRLEPESNRRAAPSQISDSPVSPEPLSDVLMPPPAMARPSGRSPQALTSTHGSGSIPVTPSTLMRIPSQTQSRMRTAGTKHLPGEGGTMDEITLPDALLPSHPSITTSVEEGTHGELTPTMSCKSAKNSALSTPRTSALISKAQPSIDSNVAKRKESKTGERGSKKRSGTTSATISPALRPKMSPSISPLAPTPGLFTPVFREPR